MQMSVELKLNFLVWGWFMCTEIIIIIIKRIVFDIKDKAKNLNTLVFQTDRTPTAVAF